MNNNLKSCPFCGGEAYIEVDGTVARLFAKHTEVCFFDHDSPLRGLQSSAGDAVEILTKEWNARAPIEPPEGYVIAPKEPSIEMVMAGEVAYENQAFIRLDNMPSQTYPQEHAAELCARVAYRAMLAVSNSTHCPTQAVLVTPQQAADAGLECGDSACVGCISGEGSCMYAKAEKAGD